ncbi:anti-sigma factor domain-containing protein [Clostridium sp.]|jgi:hypothetical protein|uniref:anti-sigma factor domain-containing protein n=1 Tax=Clostridium sp. TaxID=1506 RepID=UPI003EEBEA8D
MIKTGIVMSIMRNKAGVITSDGEFLYIKTNKALPNIGEIHTGQICSKPLYLYKYAITAASLMFVFISSTLAYAYYTPVTSIVVSTNPSVYLKANRWNKIIGSKSLDSEGSTILHDINLNNKCIDVGLELLVKKAQIGIIINEKYKSNEKIISINIKSNKDRTIDVSNFKKIMDKNNLKIKFNISSDNNKKIDIIANNQKVNTNDLIPYSDKNDTPNIKTKNKSNFNEKPSVDINTNIIEDKSLENKKENKKEINKEINKSTKPTKIKQNKKSKNSTSDNNNSDNDKSKNHTDNNKNPKKTHKVFHEFVENSDD